MTVPESDADLLRRAADRIDARARDLSGDWWESIENYTDCWVVKARWTQPSIPKRGVRNPPEPHFHVAEESSRGDLTPADAWWIAGFGPQIAAPLAAWLRSEADHFETDERSGAEDDWPPLALSRAILGETGETT